MLLTAAKMIFGHKALRHKVSCLQNIKTLSVFVQHQGTNFQFTVVPKLYQGTAAKRGVIVWRALFLFLFWRSKKEQKPAAGDRDMRSKKLLW